MAGARTSSGPPWCRTALERSALPGGRGAGVWRSLRFRLLTGNRLPPPDPSKRWDEANVLELAEGLSREAPVLECGAFNSASMFELARRGFRHIEAIDLDPHIVALSTRRIRCSVQDGMATSFDDESFALISCASVVEHGMDWDRLLAEARRLLRPSGIVYVSTDLVASRRGTEHARAFGQPWNPLVPEDVQRIADRFVMHGFERPEVPEILLPDRLPYDFLGTELGFVAFATVVHG